MKIKTILIDEESSWIQGFTTQLKDLSLKVDVVGTASGTEDGK